MIEILNITYQQVIMKFCSFFSSQKRENYQFLIRSELFIQQTCTDEVNCHFDELPLPVKDKRIFILLRPLSTQSTERDIFLQTRANGNIIEEKCDPSCTNGVCFKGECKCEDGYTGDACSILIKVEGIRVSYFVIILIYIGSAIIGMLFMYIIYRCFKACYTKTAAINENDELDMMETWARKEKDENNKE